MIRSILFTLTLFIFITPAHAKIVEEEYKYKHDGKISQVEACKIAEKRAENKAIKKALGLTVSLEESQKCKEVDGVLNCEQNQISMLSLNGNITESRILDKDEGYDDLSKIYYCKIKIFANVEPLFKKDTSFQLDVKLNHNDFRDGEKLTIDILSNEEMFLTVYIFFPYEKVWQVQKLFPNQREKNNKIVSKEFRLPTEGTEYTVEFPKNISKKRVDEHLIFIAAKKDIDWLPKYSRMQDLRKRLIELSKENIIKSEDLKMYTILK